MSETDDFGIRFGGIARLYGTENFKKVSNSKILIIGIGGVGSWVAESLARSGVSDLTLVDLDDVCVTNINRQIHALNTTVGQFKVDVMKERILNINPYCKVTTHQCFLSLKSIDEVFVNKFDFVIDACDDFTNKCHLIAYCRTQSIPLVVMGGAGGKTDPLLIRVSDLGDSQNDMLLARLRKKLRQDFDFPRTKFFGIWSIWSHERAVFPTANGCLTHTPPGRAKHMDCSEGFGSASFVTGSFAFVATSLVIKEIIK